MNLNGVEPRAWNLGLWCISKSIVLEVNLWLVNVDCGVKHHRRSIASSMAQWAGTSPSWPSLVSDNIYIAYFLAFTFLNICFDKYCQMLNLPFCSVLYLNIFKLILYVVR